MLDRNNDMLYCPERLVSGSLCVPSEIHCVLRLRLPGTVGEHDPDSDAHVSSTSLGTPRGCS
jgi:hypothetical protein